MEPQNQIGFANLGTVYYQWDATRRVLGRWMTGDETRVPGPIVFSNLGTSYFYLHRYADAVKQFERGR